MNSDDKFWMVWSPSGSAPTIKHSSEGGAECEAIRLARACPGKFFYVLEAGSAYVKDDVRRIVLDDPTPF